MRWGERVQAETVGTPAADETSDAVLLLHTREGSSESYGALYLRHVAAARVLARQLARDPIEADELVAESFTRVLGVLQRGAGPEAAFRPYLLSTMRRLHLDRLKAERRTEPSGDLSPHDPGQPFVDLPADELERSIVSSAFTSLPERWRLVLWHTEVEGLAPAQVAPLLGISANATAALAVRARAGLRDAYLSAHVAEATDPGCRQVGPSLGGYVRGTLSRRERAAVEDHLHGCARCSAAVLELSDTASSMRAVIGPLILGAAVLAYREGIIALGPQAIPAFAWLQSGGAALLHGGGTAGGSAGAGAVGTTGGTAGGSAAGAAGGSAGAGSGGAGGGGGGTAVGAVSNAGRATWQIMSAAGLAGAVAVGAVVTVVLALGGNGTPTAANPSPSSTSTTPATQPSSTATPSPTPSTTSTTQTAPSSTSTTPAVIPAGPSPTSPPSSTSSSSSTTPPVEVAAPGVDGGVTAVGDLVAGRTGYVTVHTTNPGHTTVAQRLDLDLPIGVTFNPAGQVGPPAFARAAQHAAYRSGSRAGAASTASTVAATDGPCTGAGTAVSCELGRLGPGESTDAVVPVSVDPGSTGGTLSGTLVASADGVEQSTAIPPQPVTVATSGGLNALFAAHGPYVTTAAGNSLMSCQDPAGKPDPACAAAESDRSGAKLTNGDWKRIYPRNDAGPGWKSSASASLKLPQDGSVVRAWLTWSATGLDASAKQTADLQAPGGKPVTVAAGQVTPVSVSGRDGYVAVADVTDQVTSGGAGVWTAGNISLSTVAENQVYGGWALVVLTTATTDPARDVTVLAGPQLMGRSAWSGSALGLRGNAASVTAVAWEGDAGNDGDSLSAYGAALTPADGLSTSSDAFASYSIGALSADGTPRKLTFGVDVRSFDSPAGPAAPGAIEVRTTGDNLLLGVLAVSVGSAASL